MSRNRDPERARATRTTRASLKALLHGLTSTHSGSSSGRKRGGRLRSWSPLWLRRDLPRRPENNCRRLDASGPFVLWPTQRWHWH